MIISIGANHETLGLDLREKLAIAAEDVPRRLSWLLSHGAQEAVVLSTCNRVEIYLAGEKAGQAVSATTDLWGTLPHGPSVLRGTVTRHNKEAARHLFRVTGGLNSLVLGEPQILSQVKTAYLTSLSHGATGKRLNPLFQQALSIGKLVRSQTNIAGGITSVASAGVALAEKIFENLGCCRILILGAGEMAHAALKHLTAKNIRSLTIANRTWERAQSLAQETAARVIAWENALNELAQADVVICSTASIEPIIKAPQLAACLNQRRERPMLLMDIALPRNVEEAARTLKGIYYFNMDDLKNLIHEHAQAKSREAAKAEKLIDLKLQNYCRRRLDSWLGPAPIQIAIA
ncbi:MAG: glutamyl-tRNA reductase [Elusimicrobia bacterium]|nr:glutamyl-tRNA reductase [Elusimicrobiota bacterium]